jgi:hypothetical protein
MCTPRRHACTHHWSWCWYWWSHAPRSLQFEEKQLELWTKKVEERESAQRVLKDRLQSLTELIEAKQQQATQLEQEREYASRSRPCAQAKY